MNLEIEQLPPPSSSVATALQSTAARLPTLDYTLGQISRRTLGRKAQHALDTYLAAFNRLMLIAPLPVLQTMEAINALLARVDERHSATWPEDWSTARGALAKAAGEAIEDPPVAARLRRAGRAFTQPFRRSTVCTVVCAPFPCPANKHCRALKQESHWERQFPGVSPAPTSRRLSGPSSRRICRLQKSDGFHGALAEAKRRRAASGLGTLTDQPARSPSTDSRSFNVGLIGG